MPTTTPTTVKVTRCAAKVVGEPSGDWSPDGTTTCGETSTTLMVIRRRGHATPATTFLCTKHAEFFAMLLDVESAEFVPLAAPAPRCWLLTDGGWDEENLFGTEDLTDECGFTRERSVAGVSNYIPPCPVHGAHPDCPPCGDCGRGTFYSYTDEAWHHATDVATGCFLIHAE